MEGYNLSQIFITFLIYAFLGWCLEVVFHIFKSKKFINRGFLEGPVCPIYGVGAVLVLGFLGHLSHNFWTIFIGGAIFASLLELVTGYALKKIFNTRWWDYSHKKFNIGGYISLDFTLIWGLVSVFMMDVLQPRVGRIVNRIPDRMVDPIAIIFLIIFLVDLATTVKSLVSFRSILVEIGEMREEWDDKLEERKLELEKGLEDMKKEVQESLEEQSEAYDKKRFERLRSINSRLERRHRAFLDKYPDISSEEIMDKLRKIRKK